MCAFLFIQIGMDVRALILRNSTPFKYDQQPTHEALSLKRHLQSVLTAVGANIGDDVRDHKRLCQIFEG